MCCRVIVTLRTLFWTLLSILICLTELAAFMSAHWLVSQPVSINTVNSSAHSSSSGSHQIIRTMGLFLRCSQADPSKFLSVSDNCRVYAHSIGEIASPFWTATCFCMGFGILLLFVVALFSVWALCFQNLGRKSIFSISGILQAVAGMLL